jgi:Spy/CpxP family protein refolding chaperone
MQSITNLHVISRALINLGVKAAITVAALAVFAPGPSSSAQTPEQPAAPAQHRSFGGDPVRQLNLTPEQRELIRAIREQSRDERATVNQRVREANKSLEDALEAEAADHAVIEQRIQEVSAAQAAAMRMRIMTEVKIRQVLTSEQRTILRTLRSNMHERRERRMDGPEQRQRRLERRTERLQQRRSRIRPLAPGNAQQQPQ